MKIRVIERATGNVCAEYDKKNVKSYTTQESLESLRSREDHAEIMFIIRLKGLPYSMDWRNVDDYDIEIG